MPDLVQSVGASVLIHVLPLLLLEDTGSRRNLSDDAECIFVHILKHRTRVARLFCRTVSLYIPESLSEVAVFVVEEDEVH